MKRVKLSIKVSDKGTYRYNVYRSKDANQIPANLNVLSTLEPVMVVDEKLIQPEAAIVNELIQPDTGKIPSGNRLPYGLNYKPLRNFIHYIEVGITVKSVEIEDDELAHETSTNKFKVEFNDDATVRKVTRINEAGDLLDETGLEAFEVNNKTLYIRGEYVTHATEVAATYFMKSVNVYDDDENIMDGVDLVGPVATGLSTPILDSVFDLIPTAGGSSVPVVQLRPVDGDEGLMYYYRLVAVDPIGNISDPSGVLAVHLKQEPEEIKYKIQSSSNYDPQYPQHAVWEDVETGIAHNAAITLGQPATEMYNRHGAIVNTEVPMFSADSIAVDLSEVVSDNRLLIHIPNVWKEGDVAYNIRNTKVFRTICMDNFGQTSDASEPTESIAALVPIEKIVVIKRNVTNSDTPDEPSLPEQEATETIKQWIRKNGVYYDPIAHSSSPTNIQITTAPISLMTEISLFEHITLVDSSVAELQKYNYTIYAYDTYMKRSKPITIVVEA